MKKYYDILQIAVGATKSEIKSAYYKQLKKYHPDLYKGDPVFSQKMTAEINQAYSALYSVAPTTRPKAQKNTQTPKEHQKTQQANNHKPQTETSNKQKQEQPVKEKSLYVRPDIVVLQKEKNNMIKKDSHQNDSAFKFVVGVMITLVVVGFAVLLKFAKL